MTFFVEMSPIMSNPSILKMAEEEDDKDKIVKLNNKIQAEEEEEDGDDHCYEIDPIDFSRKLTLNSSSNVDDIDDDEIILVAEKGPVALRDYPHPRHLCANFPFNTTPHESYCGKCFCYVCEKAAPCLQWEGTSGHCNVSKKPYENSSQLHTGDLWIE